MGGGLEGSMSALRAIVIALGVYGLYLPVAFFVHRGYLEIPRPPGAVEPLLQFNFDAPDQYVARLFGVQPDAGRASTHPGWTEGQRAANLALPHEDRPCSSTSMPLMNSSRAPGRLA